MLTDNNLLNEAKVCYEACLVGREKTLGPAHVETLKTAYNLAIVMLKQVWSCFLFNDNADNRNDVDGVALLFLFLSCRFTCTAL